MTLAIRLNFCRPQRISLGLLNFLRSVERTLTFDLAGLQLEERELCSTAEETGWMNAARGGGGGEEGGLGSLQYSHNTPVDCKVRTCHSVAVYLIDFTLVSVSFVCYLAEYFKRLSNNLYVIPVC